MDAAVPGGRGWYSVVWWSIAVVMTVIGVAAGFLSLGVGGALPLVAVVTVLTALCSWQLQLPADQRPPTPVGHPVATGLCGGTITLAVLGLTAGLGPTGWWASVATAAAGWPVLRRRRTFAARSIGARAADRPGTGGRTTASSFPARETLPVHPLPELATLPALSTPQLCWAWRVSYLRVDGCTCASQLHHLAELRHGYLDELQRRDPAAFRRWCPTARAASDPARFFCPPPRVRPVGEQCPPAPGAGPATPPPARPPTGDPGGPPAPRDGSSSAQST